VTARRTTGAYDEAIALAEQALNWWPAFTDLVFERALVHAARGEWLDAKMQAERALEMGDAPARFVAGSGKGSYQARSLRGAARRQLGDAQGARSDYETAMREAPQYLGATLDLMDVLLELEAPHVADAEIDRLLGDRSSGVAANLLIAAALHEQGAYDLANARYERVLVQQPTHGQALVAQAELRLLERRFAEANELSLLVDPLDRMAPRGARTAFLAAVLLHDSSLYDEPLRRITSSTELPAPERAVYVAWRELLDPTDVVALIPADPIAGLTVLTNLEALAKLQATDEFEQLYTLLAAAIPDERARRWELANLFIRRRFADMAGEELIACVEHFGPDAQLLAALGKVATMKEMWEDAEVFLSEAIALDPSQDEAHRLLTAIRERQAG
jgi:tetratricopeptide (TPR) repeat protein